jgi:hypothetical protein
MNFNYFASCFTFRYIIVISVGVRKPFRLGIGRGRGLI